MKTRNCLILILLSFCSLGSYAGVYANIHIDLKTKKVVVTCTPDKYSFENDDWLSQCENTTKGLIKSNMKEGNLVKEELAPNIFGKKEELNITGAEGDFPLKTKQIFRFKE